METPYDFSFPVYEGDLNEEGEYHGFGVLWDSKETYYKGAFEKGYMHGHGKQVGLFDTYEGEFKFDFRDGFGHLKSSNGTDYVGMFKDDDFNGQGKIVYTDGRRYEGGFIEGEYSGMGEMVFPDGIVYKGNFKNGLFLGIGKMTFLDGSYYMGEFDNLPNGNGIMIYSDGFRFDGVFEDGEPTEDGEWSRVKTEEESEEKYLFVDVETDGLPNDWDAPISDTENWPRVVQLAYLLADNKGNMLAEGDYIIYPSESTIRAKEIHTILAVDKTGMFFQIRPPNGELYWWSIDSIEDNIRRGIIALLNDSDNEFEILCKEEWEDNQYFLKHGISKKMMELGNKKEASLIHGITNEIAINQGVNIKIVLDELLEVMTKSSYVVAHNIKFDVAVIESEFCRIGMESPLASKTKICTMQSATDFCAIEGYYGYKWPKLSELYLKLFNEPFVESHNAMKDVKATAKCFWELKRLKII